MLVQPSKDKDGVVKQDWDVYIGHGLNNKHWVLEKSKWSNFFYMPKLYAKICNKRYRRHILSSKHLQGSLKELVGKDIQHSDIGCNKHQAIPGFQPVHPTQL